MADGGAVLAKMIAVSRSGSEIPDGAALAALNIAAGKVGHALFEVETAIEEASGTKKSRAEVIESAPSPGLLFIAHAVGGGIGMLSIDALLINALVELATGATDDSVCLDQRVPTPIDAALCSDFCQRLLDAYPGELAQTVGYFSLPDLSFQNHESDVAKLAFTLDDTVFRQMSGTISFQAGIRRGKLCLSLPQSIWRSKKKVSGDSSGADWRAQLTSNVLRAPLKLRADLDRVTLPLSAALSLKPSDVVPISPGALSSIDLVSDRGVGLLTGRLGQVNGKKAVSIKGTYTDSSTISPGANVTIPDQIAQMGGDGGAAATITDGSSANTELDAETPPENLDVIP